MEKPGKKASDGGYEETYDINRGEMDTPEMGDVSTERPEERPPFEIPGLQERTPEIVPHPPSLDKIFPGGFHKYINDAPPPGKKTPPHRRLN